MSKKLPREISRSVWNTLSHQFKTEISVVFSEPKDAGATERVKYVTTILVSVMINQGCISFFGEMKNKTKQNRKAPKS